jgi:hypothetical protein
LSATASPVLEPLELQRSALLNNITVRIALGAMQPPMREHGWRLRAQIPKLALKPGMRRISRERSRSSMPPECSPRPESAAAGGATAVAGVAMPQTW